MMLTADDVERRVDAMGELVEVGAIAEASRYEKVLWQEVLEEIAERGWGTSELAEQALRTKRYRFRRVP